MNIFLLDIDPKRAAMEHCDKHVVKMIVESAQMLCTAHHVIGGKDFCEQYNLYRPTHINHPHNIWIREHGANYHFLYELFLALGEEYTHRYGKVHKTIQRFAFHLVTLPLNIKIEPSRRPNWESFPCCMPDEYKVGGPVLNYRYYYAGRKAHFAKWTNRSKPSWMPCVNS